jgi:DNA-binding MarR family transcriptional regulator
MYTGPYQGLYEQVRYLLVAKVAGGRSDVPVRELEANLGQLGATPDMMTEVVDSLEHDNLVETANDSVRGRVITKIDKNISPDATI